MHLLPPTQELLTQAEALSEYLHTDDHPHGFIVAGELHAIVLILRGCIKVLDHLETDRIDPEKVRTTPYGTTC